MENLLCLLAGGSWSSWVRETLGLCLKPKVQGIVLSEEEEDSRAGAHLSSVLA